MAGLGGIVYPDTFQVDNSLLRILNTLCHRGDNCKIHTYKNIQVGICGGELWNKGDVIVGIDGKLYQTQKLKALLLKEGYPSTVGSDTEFIYLAYQCWGASCFEHIEGDFAIFIFDQKTENVFAARDRIGKKPLYWYQDRHHVVFSSEIKGILATGIVPQTIDFHSFAAYFYLGYLPKDLSPIQDINKLLPGNYLHYAPNRTATVNSYWSYGEKFHRKIHDNVQVSTKRFEKMFQESISERIPSQKPLGCALSGGLGSSAVAYYLQKQVPKEDIYAYTVGFQDEYLEDMQAATEVSKILQLKHFREIITPQNLLNDLVQIIWYLDEPLADVNVIATWKLIGLSKPTHTLFTGMASDELLAGHNRYTTEERKSSSYNKMVQSLMPMIKAFFLPLISIISKKRAFHMLQQTHTNPLHLEYLIQNALFTEKQISEAAPRLAKLFDPHIFLHRFYNISDITSTVASYLYFDVKTRLPNNYILQYDRLSCAQGISWQTPFLNTDIIEYLAGLPEPDELASKETFIILKNLLANAFPAPLINRPKKTRIDFLKTWVESTKLIKYFQKLSNGSLVELGLVSKSWIKKHTSTIEECGQNFRHLWAIFMLEIWCQIYINRPIKEYPPQITLQDLFEE